MKSKLFAHASLGFLCALFFLFSANALPTPAQRREHADKNDDGIVDRKEKHMEKKLEQKQTSKVNTWWERRADTNNDGLIDSNEATAWKTLEKEQIDVNGDGI
ncbi:MAG: hypothetical protein PHV55_03980, partial [Candidatus Omnitrophica bacterium]|nr:hypothetical protein [Candidatus Omnitrophota bacterium]